LRARLSAAPRGTPLRDHAAPEKGHGRTCGRQIAAPRDGAGSHEPAIHPAVDDRRALGAVRQLREPDALRPVSDSFSPVIAGGALPAGTAAATSARNVPRTGGEVNPSAAALKSKFGAAITGVTVGWGETNVVVTP